MSEFMGWQEVMVKASAEVVAKALAIAEAVMAGTLTTDQGVAQLVVLLAISRDQAVQLADTYTAGELAELTGREHLPSGWAMTEDHLEDEHATEARAAFESGAVTAGIAVLASAAVLDALQAGRHAALDSQGVTTWHRRPEPEACEVCRRMADDGDLPISVRPWHHKGCACSQEITITTERNAA